MSYAKFRAENNDVNALQEKFNKLNGKRDFNEFDETYWDPKHVGGSEGKGEAVIRFLPAPPDGEGGQEPDNIVKYFQFTMRRNGKTYIQRGRNSLGVDEPDPANDYNKTIWARKELTKEEKQKLLAGRQEFFIANIYVVKDPNKPENEGKVFRWRFGKQIYNLINEKLFPEFATTQKVNVFDPIEGADLNFRVISKKIPDSVTGELKLVPSYEKSEFAAPSQRWNVENGEFDKIWEQQHSLQSEIAEDKFKPYDTLKKMFDRVMGYVSDDSNDHDAGEVKREKREKALSQPEQAASEVIKNQFDFDAPDDVDDEIPNFGASSKDDAPWETNEADVKTSGATATSDDDDWFSKLG